MTSQQVSWRHSVQKHCSSFPIQFFCSLEMLWTWRMTTVCGCVSIKEFGGDSSSSALVSAPSAAFSACRRALTWGFDVSETSEEKLETRVAATLSSDNQFRFSFQIKSWNIKTLPVHFSQTVHVKPKMKASCWASVSFNLWSSPLLHWLVIITIHR